MTIQIAKDLRLHLANAMADKLSGSTLYIYDTEYTDPDYAEQDPNNVNLGTVLATVQMNEPAFLAATDIGYSAIIKCDVFQKNQYPKKALSGIGLNTGIAHGFRFYNSSGLCQLSGGIGQYTVDEFGVVSLDSSKDLHLLDASVTDTKTFFLETFYLSIAQS